MDSPQLENGYTAIANEILEQIAKIKLSPTQYRLIFVIWRYTYGFKRKEHNLTLSFLSNATGCDKRQIQRELTRLEEKKIITQKIQNGSYRKIRFNKKYTQWVGEIAIGEIDNGCNKSIGETTNGEIAIGEIDTIGEIVNPTIGEIVNPTIGEIDNQENKYINKNLNKDLYIGNPFNPFDYYEQKIGPLILTSKEIIIAWIDEDNYSEKLICKAIDIAAKKDKKNINYIEGILNNWKNANITTLEEIDLYEKNRACKKAQNQKKANENNENTKKYGGGVIDFSLGFNK